MPSSCRNLISNRTPSPISLWLILELPYRIGVHPGEDGIICAFPNSCRWFEWDSTTSTDEHTLSLEPSDRILEPLEDVGQQLALTFNNPGTLLAVGGEDGKLRVFKWPSMESILSEENAHSSVKNLDFSPDGKFLVSVGRGPGRTWDVALEVIAQGTNEGDGHSDCKLWQYEGANCCQGSTSSCIGILTEGRVVCVARF